jgi:hypothetical protein
MLVSYFYQFLFSNGTKRINIVVFWVMTPSNLLGVYGRFQEPALQAAPEQLNKINAWHGQLAATQKRT